jgi:lipopolysaccharide/colanic/teichoic acid biosynthesis glycosyltransferase
LVGKRVFDVLVGTLLCLLVMPVVLLLAAGVCLSLRTWRPFFIQDRIGLQGRRIRIPKLRTLPLDCPRYALKASLADIPVPRFTALLRRTHLDEMPQLLLVPFGNLSLVGPRPKMPDEFEPVDPVYGRARVQVPQGCTGLWQIGPDSLYQPEISPQYDAFYLEHASLRLDLWIFWRTALLILHLGPQVGLDRVPRWARRRDGIELAPVAAVPGALMETASGE